MSAQPASNPDQVVDAALAAFDYSIKEAAAHDDKIGLYLSATASGIRANKAVSDDLKMTVIGLVSDIKKTVLPISVEDIKALNKAAGAQATSEVVYAVRHLATQMYRRTIVWAFLGGLVLMGAAFGAGIALQWYRTPTAVCQAQAGGIACWYWLEPPAK